MQNQTPTILQNIKFTLCVLVASIMSDSLHLAK